MKAFPVSYTQDGIFISVSHKTSQGNVDIAGYWWEFDAH